MQSIQFYTLYLSILSIIPANTLQLSASYFSSMLRLFMDKIFDGKFGSAGDIYATRSRAAQLTSLWSWPVAPSGVCGWPFNGQWAALPTPTAAHATWAKHATMRAQIAEGVERGQDSEWKEE